MGEPTFMLVEISNKNTIKQEVYALLISFQYKESYYLEEKKVLEKKLYTFKMDFFIDASSYG